MMCIRCQRRQEGEREREEKEESIQWNKRGSKKKTEPRKAQIEIEDAIEEIS